MLPARVEMEIAMRRSVCMGILGLCFVGCGGGDSGGGAASDKKVNSATLAELTDLCNSNKAKIEATARDGCTSNGLGKASKDACEAERTKCLAMPPTIDCTKTNTKDVADCSATFGEFETCLDALAAYAKSLSCDNFDKTPPAPPACANTLADKCPTLTASASSM
jgi:hypothetical protein